MECCHRLHVREKKKVQICPDVLATQARNAAKQARRHLSTHLCYHVFFCFLMCQAHGHYVLHISQPTTNNHKVPIAKFCIFITISKLCTGTGVTCPCGGGWASCLHSGPEKLFHGVSSHFCGCWVGGWVGGGVVGGLGFA